MSTYVMSDIHGNLDKLKDMLSMIQFSSKDTLYLLGDYVDWGKYSMETILYLSEESKNKNIKCLMGNHDKMMLDIITNIPNVASEDEAFEIAYSKDLGLWFRNGGDETLLKYMRLSSDDKTTIKKFLASLIYYIPNLVVGDTTFYLCHSKPLVKGMNLEDVIWQRIKNDRLPRQFIDRQDKPILISGHTIVKNLNSFDNNGKCKIYHSSDGRYINIDCGAKTFGYRNYARLGCIRLDDMEEIYVDDNTFKC